ncbi:serine-rich adhesin for platelets-like, partial [Brachionus plicatilis]
MRPFDANEDAVIFELFTQRNDSGGRLKDADIASAFRRRCRKIAYSTLLSRFNRKYFNYLLPFTNLFLELDLDRNHRLNVPLSSGDLQSSVIPVVRPVETVPQELAPQESAAQEPELEPSLVQEPLGDGNGQSAGPSSESSVAQRGRKKGQKSRGAKTTAYSRSAKREKDRQRAINQSVQSLLSANTDDIVPSDNHDVSTGLDVSTIGILDTAFVEPYPVTDGTVLSDNNRDVSIQRTLNELAAQIQVPIRVDNSSDPVIQHETDDESSEDDGEVGTFRGSNVNRGWKENHARKSERIRLQALRDQETLDERQSRLATQICNNDQRLRAESPASQANRLASQRVATSVRQANFSPETLVQRRTTERNRIAQNRQEESPPSHNERLANRRVGNQTEDDRAERLHLVHINNQAARFVSNTHNTWKHSDPFVALVDDQGDGTLFCEYCGAIYWIGEANDRGVYSKCCQRNKIELSPIQHYHPVMIGLLDPQNSRNFSATLRKEFLDNIRQYNSSLGMASVKANFDAINLDNIRNDRNRISESRTRLPFLYKCHGGVGYKIPPMFN